MDHKPRWSSKTAPGRRIIPAKIRAQRRLIERAIRNPRIRRMALASIATDYWAAGTLCLVPFDDHQVFVDPRDDKIAHTVLAGRPWQRHRLTQAIDHLVDNDHLTSGGTFVDVGANIGLMTIYALLSGHFNRAVAIEPDPANSALLKRNLALNNLEGRVTICELAASRTAGTMRLHQDSQNFGAHSLEPGFVLREANTATDITVETLDAILTKAGLAPADASFVKVDVEGHEFAVFEGMEQLLAARVPVMAEITFDTLDATADTEQFHSLTPNYKMVVDLGVDNQNAIGHSTFEPTNDQHDLLIY